jgi:hypothetical protein
MSAAVDVWFNDHPTFHMLPFEVQEISAELTVTFALFNAIGATQGGRGVVSMSV